MIFNSPHDWDRRKTFEKASTIRLLVTDVLDENQKQTIATHQFLNYVNLETEMQVTAKVETCLDKILVSGLQSLPLNQGLLGKYSAHRPHDHGCPLGHAALLSFETQEQNRAEGGDD